MTLGYFLGSFLGIERMAVGDIKGQMGADWWPVEVETLDNEFKRIEYGGNREKIMFPLWVFEEKSKGKYIFHHPRLRKKDGSRLLLTHARFIGGTGEMLVRALENGCLPEKIMQIHNLRSLAVQTLIS